MVLKTGCCHAAIAYAIYNTQPYCVLLAVLIATFVLTQTWKPQQPLLPCLSKPLLCSRVFTLESLPGICRSVKSMHLTEDRELALLKCICSADWTSRNQILAPAPRPHATVNHIPSLGRQCITVEERHQVCIWTAPYARASTRKDS